MQIADRMRRGRVFLAGDAAHLNPPFGGHGLNTGLGDAVDLGWKLAAGLDGWGGPALLDSYQAERRPIQERVIREATANMAVTSPELLADNLDAGDAAGTRAWLAPGRSLYDELSPGFTLLARPGAGGGPIEQAARARGVPLRVVEMPGTNGAALTLVRPDQYVAWAGDREPADSLALIDQIRGVGTEQIT
jgi:2-polyprenyl-6-methoxyphenol hydroxylase-like FAD-dependent oxidoreductase